MGTKTIVITALPTAHRKLGTPASITFRRNPVILPTGGLLREHRTMTPLPLPIKRPASVTNWENTDTNPQVPRKRERLTHLSPAEKLDRRKLKNRIAAQTARDRKKVKVAVLEDSLEDVQTENEELHMENQQLKDRTTELMEENELLRREVEELRREKEKREEEKEMSGLSAVALGSAASINAPQQRDQAKAATPLLFTLLTMLLRLSSENSSTEPNTSSMILKQLHNNSQTFKQEKLSHSEQDLLLSLWKTIRKKTPP